MTSTAIRERLYDYIRIADDKKLKAIYWMLEDDISEKVEWWREHAFTKELDKDFDAWKIGKEKAYTLSEIDVTINKIKLKRKTK
jgi:hypothetical protein